MLFIFPPSSLFPTRDKKKQDVGIHILGLIVFKEIVPIKNPPAQSL